MAVLHSTWLSREMSHVSTVEHATCAFRADYYCSFGQQIISALPSMQIVKPSTRTRRSMRCWQELDAYTPFLWNILTATTNFHHALMKINAIIIFIIASPCCGACRHSTAFLLQHILLYDVLKSESSSFDQLPSHQLERVQKSRNM